MKKASVTEFINKNQKSIFPEGVCCANCCRDCRYMEMENDHYNDGTRRCAWKGEWLKPSTPACYKFSY